MGFYPIGKNVHKIITSRDTINSYNGNYIGPTSEQDMICEMSEEI